MTKRIHFYTGHAEFIIILCFFSLQFDPSFESHEFESNLNSSSWPKIVKNMWLEIRSEATVECVTRALLRLTGIVYANGWPSARSYFQPTSSIYGPLLSPWWLLFRSHKSFFFWIFRYLALVSLFFLIFFFWSYILKEPNIFVIIPSAQW